MKKSKRIISLLLSFIMLLSTMAAFGVSTFADDGVFTSGDFEYKLLDDGTVMTVGYKGNALNVIIPSEVDGYIVTKIHGDTFYNNRTNIKTVEIPNTVTVLGESAFFLCSNLEKVSIPNSVKKIGYRAFFGCYNLKYIIIPSSITIIEDASIGFQYSSDINVWEKSKIIIYGYENSVAQKYAKENEFNFITLDEKAILAEGTDTEYKTGSEKGASIHCSYPLEEFISVSVNGKTVDKSNYSLADGSTVLTFKPSYLNTLKTGNYAVALHYTIGTVETALNIKEANSQTPNKPDETQQKPQSSSQDQKGTAKSPSTGNESGMTIAISFAAFSACGMAYAVLKKKKAAL